MLLQNVQEPRRTEEAGSGEVCRMMQVVLVFVGEGAEVRDSGEGGGNGQLQLPVGPRQDGILAHPCRIDPGQREGPLSQQWGGEGWRGLDVHAQWLLAFP